VDTKEDIVYKEITKYTNVIKLKNTGKYYSTVDAKAIINLEGHSPQLEVTGE
jgi:hypothetical protein